MGHLLGPKNNNFLIRGAEADEATSRAVPSGRREGMFPGRYSEIFGLGERLGCVLNFGHSFDAIDAYLWIC